MPTGAAPPRATDNRRVRGAGAADTDAPRASWRDGDGGRLLVVSGAWTTARLSTIERLRRGREPAATAIDIGGVTALDANGGLMLLALAGVDQTPADGQAGDIAVHGGDDRRRDLLQTLMTAAAAECGRKPRSGGFLGMVETTGRATVNALKEARDLVGFIGLVTIAIGRTIFQPRRLRMTALVSHIERTGLDAMPIVGLLGFLIGVVLAYQGADQLRQFGAEIFTVNLVGVGVLREMGILLTAIIVAGRSGSAFTAEIGAMTINEEVDAIRTLGLDPVDMLVVPRMLALMITLPLLTFFANMMGLTGGAVMALLTLDISIDQYIRQLESAVTITTFLVGMVKAPVFAAMIAMIGCFQGLRVGRSAAAVGRSTTTSVVEGVFVVILLDALFSVLFSILGV
ncbi:sulfate transporter [Tistrella bauzanensis]|uniref:Sulfate transporter n=1 Tax=Tistrella bauzanensis TaxID=657419 RepID=A0ABQ1IIF9_9PROT|nr:ABC transporter permease [Tistrella bauzanensis]GGB43105.1 sulfate transporter [Tistrella bauzanensis]